MPDPRFPVVLVRGVPVVTAPVEIDVNNATGLREALLEAVALGHSMAVANLSGTTFCDTSGIHALVAAHKSAVTEGGAVYLVLPEGSVSRVFRMIGLDKMLTRFVGLDDAIAAAA